MYQAMLAAHTIATYRRRVEEFLRGPHARTGHGLRIEFRANSGRF